MAPINNSNHTWSINLLWITLLSASLFVLTHSYTGIRHDGILYLGQALNHLHPEVFHDDVFFLHGSQDQFTLFGRLYALVIESAGVEWASIGAVLLAQLFFLAALTWLSRSLLGGLWPWAIVLVSATSGLYGAMNIFRVAEPFVTARPYAEALVLLALALLYQGRWRASLASLVVASLLHPLQSLAGLLVWGLWHARTRHAWLLAALVAASIVLAGLTGVAPFDGLYKRFDPEWLEILREDNRHVFITLWSPGDHVLWVVDLALLAIGSRVLEGNGRRLVTLVGLTAIMGLGLALLADLLDNVLLIGLQSWRTLWLAHVVGLLILPLVLQRYWQMGEAGKLICGLLIYAVALRGLPTSSLALVLGVLMIAFEVKIAAVLTPRVRHLGLLALAAGALVQTAVSAVFYLQAAQTQFAPPWHHLLAAILAKPFAVLATGSLLIIALHQARWRPVGQIMIVALCLLAITAWDRRHPWATYMERLPWASHPFVQAIPKDAEVLWHEDPLATWLLLGRRSYYSGLQGAGQMFNRETAIELAKRQKVVGILGFQQEICNIMNALNGRDDSCAPDISAAKQACVQAPELDFIVLPNALSVASEAESIFQHPRLHRPIRHYLYGCAALRASPLSPESVHIRQSPSSSG